MQLHLLKWSSWSLFFLVTSHLEEVQASPAKWPFGLKQIKASAAPEYIPPPKDALGYPFKFWSGYFFKSGTMNKVREKAPRFPFLHPKEVIWPGEEGKEMWEKLNDDILKCWADWLSERYERLEGKEEVLKRLAAIWDVSHANLCVKKVKEKAPNKYKNMLYSTPDPPPQQKRQARKKKGDSVSKISLEKLPGNIQMAVAGKLKSAQDSITAMGGSSGNSNPQWLQRMGIAAGSMVKMPTLSGGVRVPIHP
ncbi:MAG: hypothetical protein M1823_004499 [Watsoniomyces obsoletus]|nr:MAG: hypothetical protein M1823_004499 [Watsoniomyces obsoletus]